MGHQNPDEKQTAFMALYEPVHRQFARFCQARLPDEQEAKDLISETVLKAYENFHKLQHPEAFLHFLFGIAHNILLQKHRRRKFWGIFSDKDANRVPDASSAPDSGAEVRILYETLQHLPEVQREAVILFEIAGFSLKEIQDIQQASLSAVKTRISRGRERLTELLQEKPQQQRTALPGPPPAPDNPLQATACISPLQP